MELSYAYELAKFALDFVGTLRSSDPEWQRQRIEEIAALKKRREVLRAEMRHELELLRIQHEAALGRERDKQARITEDYKQFLDSIDDMKSHILKPSSKCRDRWLSLSTTRHARCLRRRGATVTTMRGGSAEPNSHK